MKFKVEENIMVYIYAPEPVKYTHVCKSCGYTWDTWFMSDKEEHCPKCSSAVPYQGEIPYSIPPQMMTSVIKTVKVYHCSRCGYNIEQGARFCPKCGVPAPTSGKLFDEQKDMDQTVEICKYCYNTIEIGCLLLLLWERIEMIA